jgi:DNA-binding response OmpR family regulator
VHHRSDLCLHVWGCELDADTNLVDVCVQRLRRKVDADRPDRLIHTVRGVGYTLRAGS